MTPCPFCQLPGGFHDQDDRESKHRALIIPEGKVIKRYEKDSPQDSPATEHRFNPAAGPANIAA